MICPCCHRDMPEEELQRMEYRAAVRGRVQRRVLEKLERTPGIVGSRELGNFIYADDPDGGPMNVAVVVCRAVKGLNARMQSSGWRIRSKNGHDGGYQLEKING